MTWKAASDFVRHSHWVGQRVRNTKNRWFGRVWAVECLVCGVDVNDGFACGHVKAGYCLTVVQTLKTGELFFKPWCRAEDYEDATVVPTLWERLLDDTLFIELDNERRGP